MHLTFFSVSSRISYCLLGGGGGKGQRIFEDHMVYREGGGVQKGCIPGCGFWLNAYLRTSFRLCVSGMTPMSRFYYPNVVGKGQQVKMQRRGPVFTPTVVLTSNMSKLSLCNSGARENLCSGNHVRLTRRRSQVRALPET